MTSLRESPIRRQPPNRPTWLVPVLVVVGVLIVVGLIYAVVSLVRGGGSSSTDEPTSAPCVTTTVVPGDSLPAPAKVALNVYNASDVSGLAGKTANELRDRGFRIERIANDPKGTTIAGVGEIRFGPKAQKRAALVALYVPGATLVPLDRKGLKVDLATGAGFTGIATQADVDAALAAPSPVASGPGCTPSASTD